MDQSAPLTRVPPQPISSPSNPPYYPPPPSQPLPPPQQQYDERYDERYEQQQRPQQQPLQQPGPPIPGPQPDSGIALHLGPESQIPDHPGSMVDVPRPGQPMMPVVATPAPLDLNTARTNSQFALREYVALLRRRQRVDANTSAVDVEVGIRNQTGIVLGDLRTLQSEVRGLVKAAENHRWRRWMFGGGIAAFIPAVRKVFRRGSDEESQQASNDTEYAFRKSKGLISRIKDRLLGSGAWASVAFFVFAVLYVFQNEVSLRVAKTVHKRIKKLCERIERGDPEVGEKDIKTLEGWRWRVLTW